MVALPPALLFLLACHGADAPPSPHDRQTYARLLGETERPAAAVREACAAIRHDGLRGDCQLAALGRADREEQGTLDGWCDALDDGTPRSECWFVLGERRRRMGALEEAAAACGRAGPFAADCAQHLWADAVVALEQDAPPPLWPERLPAIARAIDRWAALLPMVDDLPLRMWTRFYERGLSRPGAPLDLDACRPLPRPDADRCRTAGTGLYARRIARRADAAGVDVCDRPARTAAWRDLVPARSHPRLDTELAALQATRCDEAAVVP